MSYSFAHLLQIEVKICKMYKMNKIREFALLKQLQCDVKN